MDTFFNGEFFECSECNIGYSTLNQLLTHLKLEHYIELPQDTVFTLIKHGFKKTLLELKHDNSSIYKDPREYLIFIFDNLQKLFISLLARYRLRFQLCLILTFEKQKITINSANEYQTLNETKKAYFCSDMQLLMSASQINTSLQLSLNKIISSIEAFVQQGSGWNIEKINGIHIKIAKYQPFKGGCCLKLPNFIVAKKAVLNIQSQDEKCFLWSVLAGVHRRQKISNPRRASFYKRYVNELDTSMLTYPVKSTQIQKFEKKNDLKINIMTINDSRNVVPQYLSNSNALNEINLLYFKNHFAYIKNMDRLLSKNGINKKFFCIRCCQGFRSELAKEKHITMCSEHKPARIRMPSFVNSKIKFNEYAKMLRNPFVAYYDFESVLAKIETVEGDPNKSYTTACHQHKVCSYSYVILDYNGHVIIHECKRSMDAAYELIMSLQSKAELLLSSYQLEKLKMRKSDEKNFQTSKICYVCKTEFSALTGKVRDHDHHLKGYNYRGAACISCNNTLKDQPFMPCIAHCAKSYDSHFLIRALNRVQPKKINIIPVNMQQYTTFIVDRLIFLDSFQFLAAPLSVLAKNMQDSEFQCIRWYFKETTKVKLMMQKGVFPYEYLDDFSKFEETKMPSIEKFSSSLNKSNITLSEYEHAKSVWQMFKCKNLGDYHDLYLRTDCLILADVFESFRKLAINSYGLDPVHYFTLPMFCWSAALKFTNVTLELLTDYDMHLFLEKGIRGGISVVSKRYAKANNIYIDGYDPNEKSSFIAYWDCNSLYATAMCQPLPISNFRWLTSDEIEEIDLMKITINANIGYIYEVDLIYPQHLHDEHNDFPLCAEHVNITDEMLSDIQISQMSIFLNIKRHKAKKLCPNLYDKNNYVVHYRNLQYYLKCGMKLKKVHRVLAFMQTAWMKPYIEYNIKQRQKATNSFEKDFFKLLNNAAFGKTMENQRERAKIEVVTNDRKCKKIIAQPNVSDFHILDENLTIMRMKRWTVYLNKPIYTGFTILDISKLIMYRFYYDVLKCKFRKNQLSLLYMDTDSFIFHVQTRDLYRRMLSMSSELDTSDFPSNHFLYSTKNKKVNGKFKDEANGMLIKEFVGLKAKMYSILFADETKLQRAKGVKKDVVKNEFTHEMYIKALDQHRVERIPQWQIVSKMHDIFTVKINKLGLHPFDDKRYVLENKISTLAHGHFRIKM